MIEANTEIGSDVVRNADPKVVEALRVIRGTIRNLPVSRRKEIFNDFKDAVDSQDIGYLADTIANWAAGGKGYSYAPVKVNKTPSLRNVDASLVNEEILKAYWAEDDEDQI